MFRIRKQLAITAVLAACLIAGGQIAQAQAQNHHSHHDKESARITLNNGKKWATDDNLRLGMKRIQDVLTAGLPAIHSGRASAEQYNAMAKLVHKQVDFMVQNCILDKDADAMLHLVITEIIAGADAMADRKSNKTRLHGAEQISHALENYGAYFEHPGWNGIKRVD